ncbi:hypothetical protein [Oleiagrimonas soli]|uniref:Small-conductance mechanosensitive channel n=1 Tax=Oleiagrimonas soli TaxID=1543381 RepID=A0A099CZK3_9GAMM|nr:hypothetical protein [Oleiagrimonas soli]KGI79219.1 hypothetical protein LF63_0100040 [Oleiagrimonas soli]MBB6184894.1 small-conductance mechanosensitive channel [Oleiagrimonas soli]
MHNTTSRLVLIGLLACSASALAWQAKNPESYRYSWRDDSGLQHFSDSLNNEAIKNGYDVINSSGLVVRHVQRQLSPEERKVAEAAQAKADAAQAAAERQHAQDMQMLSAYPNEQVFRDAQQAEINELTQAIRTTQINLHAQEQNLADLLSHAADIKHDGKPVPAFLNQRIDTQRKAVTEQRATLARQQQAKVDAEKHVEELLARYRKLRAAEDAQTP